MRVPSYRRHSSGNARVTINGKDHYLGEYGSSESREKYKRLIAEYKASRQSKAFGKAALELQDVLLAFLRHAKVYYRGTTNHYRFKVALRPVADLYATLPAREFGPRQYKAIREQWIESGGRCRKYINEQMAIVTRVVKWAVAEEMMDPDQLTRIQAVQPLERGRTKAKDNEEVKPVPDDLLRATLPYLTPVLRDMVQLQLLTGCRPGELVQITPDMVDRSNPVWEIRLDRHKTAHRGKKRTLFVGPKAQAILIPYLLRPAKKACFSPQESERQRLQARRDARVTPDSCGNRPGTNRIARKPRVAPGESYTSGSYRKAVFYACLRAFPYPKKDMTASQRAAWRAKFTWSPNQLRHNAGTEIRKAHGIEAASVLLGHSKIQTTEIYAEKNTAKAIEIAQAIG